MAASTAAPNPLAQSLAKVTGLNALSTSTGTSPIDYENPGGFRGPSPDIIQITGNPGTGATTAETWKHEVELESLKQEQAKFAYEQQQNILQNARAQAQLQLQQQQYASQLAEQQRQFGLQQSASQLAQQEYAAKLAEQQRQYGLQQAGLGISQSQLGIQQAAEQRAVQLAPAQLQAAQLANQQATLEVAAKQRAEADALKARAIQEQAFAAQAPIFAQIARDNAQVIGGAYRPTPSNTMPGY